MTGDSLSVGERMRRRLVKVILVTEEKESR